MRNDDKRRMRMVELAQLGENGWWDQPTQCLCLSLCSSGCRSVR
jgi:hypothetical protein